MTDHDDKTALNLIAERAQDRARSKAGASIGTATHAASEMADAGESIEALPADIRRDVEAYREWIQARRLAPLAAEIFVVNEALGVAGTFDRLMQGPNKAIVSDMKTSANPAAAQYAGLSWAIQIAAYATALPWLPDKGIVSWESLGLPAPDPDRGLVIHLMQGQAEVSGYSIDLKMGLAAAKLAVAVRDIRKSKEVVTPV